MYKVRFVFGSKHNQFIAIDDYKLEKEISFAGKILAINFSKETYVPVQIVQAGRSLSTEYWLKEKVRGPTMIIYKWGWFSDEEAYDMVKDIPEQPGFSF